MPVEHDRISFDAPLYGCLIFVGGAVAIVGAGLLLIHWMLS
jgi:hypothetical protein